MAKANIEVELKDVRLSFAHIFKPQRNENDDGTVTEKYNCSFLLDKNTKQGRKNIAAMEKAIEEAKEAKWGNDVPKLKDNKLCLRDGDDEEWDGYADHMYVSASNSRRPTLVNRRGKATTEREGLLYSGCFVNAIIRVWAQDNKHGKRVNASLEGIQFLRDGEAFGAAPLSEDRFSDLGDDEDGEDDEEDERPAKKSGKKARDEDDEDDEDERPAKKSSKKKARDEDDEDDEDERPAKKKKSRKDYDDEDDDDEVI